jgi:hypothetical protein
MLNEKKYHILIKEMLKIVKKLSQTIFKELK